ncbi:hypothetical protein BH11ACT4_BH11ACT4_23810 [soil metagenome]
MVSAYESGAREPGVETIRKLVNAAGFDLTLGLTRQRRSRLQRLVESRRSALSKALADLGASNIRLFGSVARGEDGPDSDVDLLVDVDVSTGLFALGRMRSAAETILGMSVDIVPANSLKADVVDRILAEAIPL